MPNTPTTPASVASRLTDEEIETNARGVMNMAWFSNYEKAGCSHEKIAAVLRDYVRLRKMVNEVNEIVSECNILGSFDELKYEGELPHTSKILDVIQQIEAMYMTE